MTHKKTVKEQVKAGFVMAGELVGGFLVFLLASIALQRLFLAAPTYHFVGPPTALVELLFATIVMFCTAERWGGFIPGFLFLTGAIRSTVYNAIPPSGVTRSEAVLLAVY